MSAISHTSQIPIHAVICDLILTDYYLEKIKSPLALTIKELVGKLISGTISLILLSKK